MSDSEIITIRINNEEKNDIDKIMKNKNLKRSKAIKAAIKLMVFSLELE